MKTYLKSLLTVVSFFCTFFMAIVALDGDRLRFFEFLPFGLLGLAWLLRKELSQ